MLVGDFSVNDDLLEVRIPTYKETANHRPVYQSHYRLAAEYPEKLLLRSLQEQKKYAMKCHGSIAEKDALVRLMISPKNSKRVISSNEFNAYLENICKEQRVIDAYGKPAHITMYSLRHANGAEMARSTAIGPQEFSRAFAHNSHFSDDSYSYASKHDEMQYTAPFTRQVREQLSPQETNHLAQIITPMRLRRFQENPDVHLIGTHSVCLEKGCTPQFVRCVFCENYRADERYIPEAERCCEMLRKRIGHCRVTEDVVNLQFNELQLAAYTEFIRRAKEGSG